ncbi:unnamed protein product [Agarophyton chilense]
MADETYDVDQVDTAENDVEFNGGGYVDDDIEIDDDEDDDDPILKIGKASAPSTPKVVKKRIRAPTATEAPQAKRLKGSDAHHNDYFLKAAGNKADREFVIAKFMDRAPDLSSLPNMRVFRDGEGTVKSRKAGLDADKKQIESYNSFTGSRKVERYRNLGIINVRDRAKKGWTMEVAPRDVADQLAEKKRSRMLKKASRAAQEKNDEEPDSPEPVDEQELLAKVDTFNGVFEGRNTRTSYAFLVMQKGSRTVEVYPVDDTSWFTFRAKRNLPPSVRNIVNEPKPKKDKLEARLQKYQDRYEINRAWREHDMGDDSRLQKHTDGIASFGIKRKKASSADDGDAEALDFDQVFDDDDVAQVDLELVEKPEKYIHVDAKRRHDLEKMLKDDPMLSPPKSPVSDDEDASKSQGTRSPSPTSSRPPSGPRTSPKSRNIPQSKLSQNETSPRPTSSLRISPSPNRSSRGNTPKRIDLSHLLPPPGVLPTEEHVRSVLLALIEGKRRITLKKVCSYFEIDKPDKKTNLSDHLKRVANFTKDPNNPRKVFLVPKAREAPTANASNASG